MSGLRWRNFEVSVPGLTVAAGDVDVEPGEWLVVRAPSGFGKSTLFRGILGLEKTSGDLFLGARRMNQVPVPLRNFGVVFQDQLLFPHLNAFQNALFGVKLRGGPSSEDRARVEDWFQELDLAHRKEAPLSELSGGERQRVALIRALAYDPDLLLLDEPFRGLDAKLIEKCRALIEGFLLRRAIPVVWITHQNEFEPRHGSVLFGGELNHGRRHFQHHSGEPQAN
jgi:putative spermidine/putrescine transport system ATP-binding protein